jgi:hypothetical protein
MARRKRGDKTGPLPTAEELVGLSGAVPLPINFAQLIADGVLREGDGGWYEVLDYARLPEHVRMKIVEVEPPNRVKFSSPGDPPKDAPA